MLEGRLSASAFTQLSSGAPTIRVEVFKLPDRHAVPQNGTFRISTETGYWRYESLSFDGPGSYEVVASVVYDGRSDFKSVKVECLSKQEAYRQAIDADRQQRGRAEAPAANADREALSRVKARLYQLQNEFQDAYMSANDLGKSLEILSRTLDLIDPVLPAFADDKDLQNYRAYAFKNYAMVMRDRGDSQEAERALNESERMFAAVRQQYPLDPSAWNGLGNVAVLRNDPAAGLYYIDRALELFPDYPEAKYDREIAAQMLKMQAQGSSLRQ